MKRRPRGRGFRKLRSSERRRNRWATALVSGGLLLLVGVLSFAYRTSTVALVPIDPESLCRQDEPPPIVTAILLDISDSLAAPQRAALINKLEGAQTKASRFELFEVFEIDRAGARLVSPLFHRCNPGTGEDMNRLYQNPQRAKLRWQQFSDSMQFVLLASVSRPSASTSPIFEAIQSIAVSTFGRPQYASSAKRLIVVSDLLQFVPSRIDMYRSIPVFEDFKKSPYYSSTRSDLRNVSVEVLYLDRPNVETQDSGHIQFWEAYFAAQGASLNSVTRIFGGE